MKGVVLTFNDDTSHGIVSAADGKRYDFAGANWRSERYPGSGMHVDFEVNSDSLAADNIYIDPCMAKNADKNRMAASMLAFFFGGLGFHKFYLGNNTPATIMLCVSLGGLILLAIPSLIMMIIGFIEFIIYVTQSDEDFEQTYIVGRKDWF
ncbi:MAG: TM2 domain-containing membrane protein YozV [Bermanella sp.]|jgi:TM2 domain-containing membrane protein YozV